MLIAEICKIQYDFNTDRDPVLLQNIVLSMHKLTGGVDFVDRKTRIGYVPTGLLHIYRSMDFPVIRVWRARD